MEAASKTNGQHKPCQPPLAAQEVETAANEWPALRRTQSGVHRRQRPLFAPRAPAGLWDATWMDCRGSLADCSVRLSWRVRQRLPALATIKPRHHFLQSDHN